MYPRLKFTMQVEENPSASTFPVLGLQVCAAVLSMENTSKLTEDTSSKQNKRSRKGQLRKYDTSRHGFSHLCLNGPEADEDVDFPVGGP